MTRAGPLATGALLALALHAAAGEGQGPVVEYVEIPGTRVSLKRPYRMQVARNFSGLTTPDGAIQVLVTEVQRPLEDARRSFAPDTAPGMGLTMLARSEVEIAGHPGFIAYLRNKNRQAVWLAAFGDERESVVLRGHAPFAQAKQVTEVLHEVLVSARWDRERVVNPFHGLDFELAGKIPLRFAARIGTDLYFTRDGELRSRPEEPELVVSQHPGKLAKEQRDEFCKTELEGTPGVGLTSLAQQADVRIDGLDGCEMLVRGKELATKQDLLVYQLILFDVDRHYRFRGRVGWEQQFRFAGSLLETSRAFKRRG